MAKGKKRENNVDHDTTKAEESPADGKKRRPKYTKWADVPAKIRKEVEDRLGLYQPAALDPAGRPTREGLRYDDERGLLNLFDCDLRDNAAEALFTHRLADFADAVELSLWGNSIGDIGARALADHLKTVPNLREVRLSGNRIGKAGARALAEHLKSVPNLRKLDLRSNRMGEAGARALAEHLRDVPNLIALDVDANSIGEAGASALAAHLHAVPNLTALHLNGNSIDDAGACALAEHLHAVSNLEELNLHNNSIGEVGATALIEAIGRLKNLKELFIAGNVGFTDIECLRPLVAPRGMLKRLNMDGCTGIQAHYGLEGPVMDLHDPVLIFREIDDALGDNGKRLPRVKAIVLGNRRVGKTRLRHRLMNQVPPSNNPSSESFEIVTLPDVFVAGDTSHVRVRLFDVAWLNPGHSEHRLFLTSERKFFIIACNGAQSPEQVGLPYWLRMVHRFAGDEAQVIVVVSWADEGRHEAWTNWKSEDEPVKKLYAESRVVFDYMDSRAEDGKSACYNATKLTEVKRHIAEVVSEFKMRRA